MSGNRGLTLYAAVKDKAALFLATSIPDLFPMDELQRKFGDKYDFIHSIPRVPKDQKTPEDITHTQYPIT